MVRVSHRECDDVRPRHTPYIDAGFPATSQSLGAGANLSPVCLHSREALASAGLLRRPLDVSALKPDRAGQDSGGGLKFDLGILGILWGC